MQLEANSPRVRSRVEIDQRVPATAEGGRRPLRKFSDFTRSVESTKKRKKRLGDFAKMMRSSARNSRRQRRDETRLHPRRRSRPFSATVAARLGLGSAPGLGLGSLVRSRALFKRLPAVRFKPSARSPGRISSDRVRFPHGPR